MDFNFWPKGVFFISTCVSVNFLALNAATPLSATEFSNQFFEPEDNVKREFVVEGIHSSLRSVLPKMALSSGRHFHDFIYCLMHKKIFTDHDKAHLCKIIGANLDSEKFTFLRMFVNKFWEAKRHTFDISTIHTAIESILNPLRGCYLLFLESRYTASPKDPFLNGLGDITSLNLSGKKLKQLEVGCFAAFQSLKSLDLSDNNLVAFQAQTFLGLGNLKDLYLQNNQIDDIDVNSFLGLKFLETLNLSNNNLARFCTQTLASFHSLQHLFLGGNKLKRIEAGRSKINIYSTFRTTGVAFSSGGVGKVDDAKLQGYQNLKTLDLSSNNLTEFDARAFHGICALENLNLNHNALSEIHPDTFQGLVRLTVLDLSNNQIQGLNHKCFSALASLVTLYIRYNRIMILHPEAFAKLVSLRELYLKENQIKLDPELKLPASLTVLELDENRLDSLSVDFFQGMEKLTSLSLVNNKLKIFPDFERLRSLQILDLSGNPLEKLSKTHGYLGKTQLHDRLGACLQVS